MRITIKDLNELLKELANIPHPNITPERSIGMAIVKGDGFEIRKGFTLTTFDADGIPNAQIPKCYNQTFKTAEILSVYLKGLIAGLKNKNP